MHRFIPLALLLAYPLVTLAETPAELEERVRGLSKEIEKARGLKFKKEVVVRLVARGKDERPGVNAYYDIRKKEIVLYDDIKGNYSRGVLIHELVHALQDQHFDLKKLHEVTFGTDAELARAALVEGDAMLVTIEMLGKEQPGIAKMLSSPLEKSKNLQNGFLYGQGARWVKAIKDKGGWAAVDKRYAFPPMSTASILHPGEFIMPVKLGLGRTLGEFGIIKMLLEHDKTAPKAVEAASGWRGDRLITEGEGTGWAVAFATEKQAERFHGVLQAHPAKSKSAITRTGKRVYEIAATTEAQRGQLLERLQGRPVVTVYSAAEKKEITFGQLIDALSRADIICIGEQHDSEADHHIQLMVVKGLYALEERIGVGMEMFQRPYQKALDRYVGGDLSEAAMLEDTEYQKRWGYDWGLYRPIADYCRRNKVALAGLNISNELRGRISKVGHAKLTDEEKKLVGDVDFGVKAHRDHHFPGLGEMHGGAKMGKEQQERMYQIMCVWDEYMADSAVRFLRERGLRKMVVLAGGGHIEKHFGIPDRAAKRLKGGVVRTVRIVSGGSLESVAKDPRADFVILAR